MFTIESAMKSLKRVTFTDEQRARSTAVWEVAENLLQKMWKSAPSCPELTLASRALEEALMWHSKAISTESK